MITAFRPHLRGANAPMTESESIQEEQQILRRSPICTMLSLQMLHQVTWSSIVFPAALTNFGECLKIQSSVVGEQVTIVKERHHLVRDGLIAGISHFLKFTTLAINNMIL